MLLNILVILSNLGIVFMQPGDGWSDYRPIQSIALEMPDIHQPSIWNILGEMNSDQAGAMVTHLKTTLQPFRSKSSYVLAKGSHVISKHSVAGINLEDFYELPYSNVLALLSFNLGILLEGFRPAVIYQPMIKSLKGKDQNNPNLRHKKESSLLDLLTSLPPLDKKQSVQDSESVLSGLAAYGLEAVSFVNIVLGKDKHEAWLDSFYALSIEEAPLTSDGRVKMRIRNLISYSLAVIHELNKVSASSKTSRRMVDQHYMYGWWINCPRSLGSCLCPQLPKDLIISASPGLRIYIVPSVELTLVVHNKDSTNVKSLNSLMESDQSMWREILVFLQSIGESSEMKDQNVKEPIDPEEQKMAFEDKNEIEVENLDSGNHKSNDADGSTVDEDQSLLVHYIHQVWPVLVFLFWVISSHVWVYWMFHCCWLLATAASKRTHIPRPKSGARN